MRHDDVLLLIIYECCFSFGVKPIPTHGYIWHIDLLALYQDFFLDPKDFNSKDSFSLMIVSIFKELRSWFLFTEFVLICSLIVLSGF